MTLLRSIGLAIAGFLVLLGFSMLGRSKRQLRKAEDRETALLIEGTETARLKAERHGAKATKLQARAAEALNKGRELLDEVGKDEDMASILSDWRS